MSDEPKFLTAKQVASRYGLSVQWVYHCRELQDIAVRIGARTLRYPLDRILEFEQTPRTRPTATGSKGYDIQREKRWSDKKRNERVLMVFADEPKKYTTK